jgi:hypothetical protein
MGWIKEIISECYREVILLLRLLSGAVGISAFLMPFLFIIKAPKRWEGCLLFIGSLVVCVISLLLGSSFIFFGWKAPDEEVVTILIPILLFINLRLSYYAGKAAKSSLIFWALAIWNTICLLLFPLSVLMFLLFVLAFCISGR